MYERQVSKAEFEISALEKLLNVWKVVLCDMNVSTEQNRMGTWTFSQGLLPFHRFPFHILRFL